MMEVDVDDFIFLVDYTGAEWLTKEEESELEKIKSKYNFNQLIGRNQL